MAKRMILMLVAVGILFGGIFGYKAVGNYFMNQFFDDMPVAPATITATEVTEAEWRPEATAVGTFMAVNGAQLTSEANGIVTGIHFENGARVTQGQRLVSMDIEADEAELERLQAVERLALVELNRHERLYRENNISESELQRRESEAAQASAAVKTQEARIRQKTIRAPFDGISGIRQVNLGQYVGAGSPVVSVQSLDPIFLNFTLPERRLPLLHVGQQVNARADAYPETTFTGEITAIEPSIQESTRTFLVQATFANADLLLRPGMFGRAQVDIGEPDTVKLVPQTAIQFNPYGNSVFIIREDDDGTLRSHQRFVMTGERRGDLITVVDGLEVGDRIATSGLLKLRTGSVVIISDNGDVAPTAELDPQPENQ
ncbi:efflux RND transporter periplasmic adaptor subunit [Marinimicrobium sp. ABcell2]|uniref:efflux RND transporter periplasmic adaptor subunit n=1 Tax=Marinimicrobium sp. ABcell2 TaxID=3069751 RepID=UPI0027B75429|nr:efflux RND transporter periplasmic adaptor subunit [Marinimicrobium sp. ABcell2]MDQ2077768.1 efflux RND transporter periplasmic adaptor subunit [Marinimicrobium sp. ABcell2]